MKCRWYNDRFFHCYFNEIPVKFHKNFGEILVKLHWNFIKITMKKLVIIPAVFAQMSVKF